MELLAGTGMWQQLMILMILFFAGCNSNTRTELQPVENKEEKKLFVKPASRSMDTLWITGRAAVFFEVDKEQLEQLSSTLPENILETMMHEYFYQMRNARQLLKQEWQDVQIVETSTARWLAFKQTSSTKTMIDLDKNNELCGIYLFNPPGEPIFTDMMNIDTQAGFYFNDHKN